jgi:uridylate kinase
MKVVISLGGSLLTRELTSENFKKYTNVLKKLYDKGHKLVVVCGGGKTCRDYQKIARDSGADDVTLDRIGIVATHLNAMTLIGCLGEYVHPISLRTVEDVKKYFNKKILVFGGNLPGHSTDYDAALFAEAIGADILINATDVDGVYSSDPDKDPKAKKFEKLSYDEFIKIVSKNIQAPGKYGLFDLKAAEIVKKAGVKTVVIDATDAEEIARAIEGKHKGTTIE